MIQGNIFVSNPKANYLAHKDEIEEAIFKVLNSGTYILGNEVKEFENEFSKYIGCKFGIGVGSGTEALHIALKACGIGPDDEVITVSHTAVATISAIELSGAIPVLIDIVLDSYTIDPNQIENAISKKTKAIIPVHIYGHPAEMDKIMEIANHYNLWVIEDCAQSHGASFKDKKTGAWGHIAAFSFYPTKNLGAIGDGGMILTNSEELANQARLLREYGWKMRYISEVTGLNSRLDEIQAAILRKKLKFLDSENQKRELLAKIYNKILSSSNIIFPKTSTKFKHVYHQYVIRTKNRDSLKNFLLEKEISTSVHYPIPIHCQPAYKNRIKCIGSMLNTNKVVKEILSLPIYPELTIDQVYFIGEEILKWDKNMNLQ